MKIHIKLLVVFVLLTSLTHGQDWNWKNPLPTGNILNEVKYIDSENAIAVGSQGTILKTSNNGLSWDIINSKTNTNLKSIAIINKDTVYISGGDHSIYKSVDGGDTWLRIFDGTGANDGTSQLFFTSPTTGYLLGNSMQLFKTIDCGKTWNNLNVGLEFQNVPCIYFTSDSVGYGVSSPMFLKTIDGGLTWNETELPENTHYKSILFTDDNTGYLIGISGTLLKTENAGESWVLNESLSDIAYFADLQSIEFVNYEVGYLVGSKRIYKTMDSGDSWEEVWESSFDLFSVSFSNAETGIAVGGDWLYEVSGIITTSDGGNNWAESSYSATTKYIDEIKFVNDNLGYAVGGHVSATYSGYVMKTEDAGDTWLTLNLGTNIYWITDIAICDNNIIYTVGQEGQILKSTNGGLSWIEQNSNTSESLYVVQFTDNNIGYVAGENGTIIKTSNGGDTWQKLESNTTKTIQALFFKNSLEGYITYHDWSIDSTVLLTTTNGGLDWSSKNIGTLRYPREIVFVNNDTAFIVGSFGGILRTMDGGNNWEASYQNGNDYMDVFFTTEETGYIVGEDGEISMTENCGDNWTLLNSGTDKQVRSVFFTDINTGYVTGGDGIILKTTNSGSQLKELNQPYLSACKGDTIVIKPNTIGGKKPLAYTWPDGQTGSYITVKAEKDSTYTVLITDSDQISISVEISLNVTEIETPSIELIGDTLISSEQYGNQWYKNDVAIQGANANTYIPTEEGRYYSIVSKYSYTSDKSNIIDFPLNIESLFQDNVFVYPNPANSFIKIKFPKSYSDCAIIILDLQGKVLMKRKAESQSEYVDINDYDNGLYLLKMSVKDKIITQKLLVVH